MAENWDEPAAAQVAELPEIKLFGKWSSEDVQVADISLAVSLHFLAHCNDFLCDACGGTSNIRK